MEWEYIKNNNVWRWLFLAGMALSIPTIFGFLARLHMIFEILNTFRVQYFILLLLLSLPFFITKRFKSAAFISCFTLINFFCFYGVLFNSNGADTASFEEKILVFNVFSPNQNYEGTVKYILEEDPDHVVLLELTHTWEKEILTKLKKKYPHYTSIPRRDNFGIMFLSKQPYEENIFHLDGLPFIKAVTKGTNEENVTIFAVHPLPPIRQDTYLSRNKYMHDLKDFVNEVEGNKIISGDFNMTPWCPFFRDFTKATNTFTQGGVCPTWPAGFWPLWVPIDNALLSQGMILTDKKSGPHLNSDHLPLTISYSY